MLNTSKSTPQIIMMIGVPSSGKSYFVTKYVKGHLCKKYIALSYDDEIENFARDHPELGLVEPSEVGKGRVRYNDVQSNAEYDKLVEERFYTRLEEELKAGHNIIVDRTGASRKRRAKILSRVPDNYKRIAFVMDTPLTVIRERWKQDSKGVPAWAVRKKFEELGAEPVTKAEGFDDIRFIHLSLPALLNPIRSSKDAKRFIRGDIAEAQPEWYDSSPLDELIEEDRKRGRRF